MYREIDRFVAEHPVLGERSETVLIESVNLSVRLGVLGRHDPRLEDLLSRYAALFDLKNDSNERRFHYRVRNSPVMQMYSTKVLFLMDEVLSGGARVKVTF